LAGSSALRHIAALGGAKFGTGKIKENGIDASEPQT
jgi:hypothetical protein